MTLTLHFPAGPMPGAQASTILVTGAPDEDPVLAERFARAVLLAGVGPAPRMGRVSWEDLVDAGLAAGILARTPGKAQA